MSKQRIARCALLILTLVVCVAQAVLIMCKLCGLADWSWWIVLMPLWIDYAVSILVGIVISIYEMIVCHRKRR